LAAPMAIFSRVDHGNDAAYSAKHIHIEWHGSSAEVIKLIRFQLNDDAQTFEETKAVKI